MVLATNLVTNIYGLCVVFTLEVIESQPVPCGGGRGGHKDRSAERSLCILLLPRQDKHTYLRAVGLAVVFQKTAHFRLKAQALTPKYSRMHVSINKTQSVGHL